jgi:hypothetical protein
VTVPASKLIIGLANAWAATVNGVVLILPSTLGPAHEALAAKGMEPRGYAYWTIADEGEQPNSNGVPLYMATGLNDFLCVRSSANCASHQISTQ